jgi:hypothetical protein
MTTRAMIAVATGTSARVGQRRNVVVYEMPLPGYPTDARDPRGPTVTWAPRRPREMLGPDLDHLSETPLQMRCRR